MLIQSVISKMNERIILRKKNILKVVIIYRQGLLEIYYAEMIYFLYKYVCVCVILLTFD